MSRWETVFKAMIADANRESDRGCALILSANLDNRLRVLLENFFITQSKNKYDKIFQGNGCLSTFSSRIAISFSLGLLGEDEKHDLDIIRLIRNDFAHLENFISFSSAKISDRCDSLKLYQNMKIDAPDIDFSNYSGRNKFQTISISLCLILEERAKDSLNNKRLKPKSKSVFPSKHTPSV